MRFICAPAFLFRPGGWICHRAFDPLEPGGFFAVKEAVYGVFFLEKGLIIFSGVQTMEVSDYE